MICQHKKFKDENQIILSLFKYILQFKGSDKIQAFFKFMAEKSNQILKLKCFLYPLAVVFAQSIDARR